MAFPAHIGTGLIVGAFESWVLDDSDADALPDRKPMVGLQITITPSVTGGLIRNETDGTLVAVEPLKVTTNADGVLGYYESEGDEGSWHTGVRAVSPQDDQLAPSGWTYRVVIHNAGNARLADFAITFPPGAVFDLAKEAPVPPSPGSAVAEWERVRAEVRAEAAAAVAEVTVGVTDLGSISGLVSVTQAQSRSSVLSANLTGDATLAFEPGISGLAYTCTLLLTGEHELTLSGVYTAYGVPLVLSGDDMVHVMWAGDRWIGLSGAVALAIPGGWA